jgi:hypothetical protein
VRRLSFPKVLAAVFAAAIIAAVASAASKHPAVSMTAGRGPVNCRAADVHALVDDFVTAFNRGDSEDLSLIWVRIRFQWYAVNDVRGGRDLSHIEYTRLGALTYFAQRYQHGERLQLADFQYGGFNAGWGHFDFHLRRRAPDIRHGRWADYIGAGTASCLNGPVGLGRWTMSLTA